MISKIIWPCLLLGMTLSKPLASGAEPNKFFWLLAYLSVAAVCIKKPNALLEAMRQNYVVLLIPALAFLSAIWSPSPGDDLYNSFQFLVTNLIGFVIVMQNGKRETLHILFRAFGLAVVFSLVALVVNPRGAIGSWAGELNGIYQTKNELGDMSALLMLSTVALFLGEKRSIYLAIPFVLGLGTLALTRSGTATIATVLVLSLTPSIAIYKWRAASLPSAIGLQLLVAVPIIAFLVFGHVDVFDALLGSVGKDSTLTGRTVLWGFAIDGFKQSPWIGYGFKGWWDPSNPNVFFLRYVVGQDLWYFHNVFLEMSVSFGIVGVFLMLLTLATGFRRAIGNFFRSASAINIWNVFFMIYVTIDCTAENALFVNHSLHQLILATIFASTARSFHERAHRYTFEDLPTISTGRDTLAAGRA
jgi:O-antigen ligase